MDLTERDGSNNDGSRYRVLHALGLVSTVLGAIGSLALMLYAGRENTHLSITFLFVVWVLAPFAALLIADRIAKRWPQIYQTSLYATMLVVSSSSIIVYAFDIKPTSAPHAFVYVAVPPISVALIAAVALAGILAKRRSP